MLKKGLAWHYTAYDKRQELETVKLLTNVMVLSLFFKVICILIFLKFLS